MRTKKGDMVRLCFHGERPGSNSYAWPAELSRLSYRVVEVHGANKIRVDDTDGDEFTIKSWVRCADMKKGSK